jgi:glutamyl/glutaminyl-tRNA synthetase
MKITHVIRGEEWLPSAPLHVLLYEAFGWEAPKFAHLPLILKPDPVTYITKRTKQQFAEQFAKEYAEKERVEFEEVLKVVSQIFANPKDLNNQLRSSDKDSNDKKAIKDFLKKAMYGKLSKRDGDRLGFPVFPLSWPEHNITGYRESGYLPDAFLNILVMLGWNPGTNQEVFAKEELIETFSLERVGKSGAKFDPDKARWYNQQFLRKTPSSQFVESLKTEIEANGLTADNNYIESVIEVIKEKATFSSDFWELSSYFFSAPKEYAQHVIDKKWDEDAKTLFVALADKFDSINNFSAENAEMAFQATGAEQDIDSGKYMQLLRVMVTGVGAGPAIYETLALIGKQEVVSRIKKALDHLA